MRSRAAALMQMWWSDACKIGFGLCMALMLILFACGKRERENMLAYMEQKYGEAFAPAEAWGGQFGKDYTMLRVRSCKGGGEGIMVRASGKEPRIYQDNYLAYLLKEEIQQKLKELAVPVFGSCKVFYRIPELVFPQDFPADMDVDAFLRHPGSMVKIYIYVKGLPKDGEKQVEDFFALLQEQQYVIGGVISYPADEKMYGMITEENFRGDIYQGYQSIAEAVFSMDEKGKPIYLEWKGALSYE